MHPRVVNVRDRGATWTVYAGRGVCPCRMRPCLHRVRITVGGVVVPINWGNPFTFVEHGHDCMRLFFDHVDEHADMQERARLYLPGIYLGCYCRGRSPVCHAEVWCGLADGRPLDEIRAELLDRLPR